MKQKENSLNIAIEAVGKLGPSDFKLRLLHKLRRHHHFASAINFAV